MLSGRALWTFGLTFGVLGVTIAAIVAAVELITERRAILIKHVESEAVAAAEAVASVVSERERDIRNDLHRVIDARKHAATRERQLEIVRSHLIGMNRSSRRYLRLWYLEEGEVVTEVSGFLASDVPLPKVSSAELKEVDMEACASPGTIAGFQATVPAGSPYDSLRLIALSDKEGEASVVMLVNMDVLFDALQARATLGLDLWVVDVDGSVLVDPDSPWHQEVLAAIASKPNGQIRMGAPPSLWPFSNRGLASQVLVWRSIAGQPLPWITAVAAPLDPVTRQVHAVASVAMLVAALVLTLSISVAGLLFYFWNRQAQLKESLATLNTIDRLREQLLHLEKLSTIGQVAAGLAHEMGTPLGVIAIRIEQLLEKVSDERQKNALAIMRGEIDRINRIMRQLLDSSRPAAARMSELGVREAALQVAELMAERYRKRKIDLSVEVPPETRIVANPDQFQQVMLNLMVNACDACRAADKVKVVLQPRVDQEGRVGIGVADSGPGVPQEIGSRVFEPFFTTKPKGEGTGLGLTIVREIMERHRGRVEFVSGAQGTTVTTWWPMPQRNALLLT